MVEESLHCSRTTIGGNTSFIENSASKHGGGVCLSSSNNIVICGNTTFIRNSAMVGGGVYARSNSSVKICGNTAFISNSAIHGGGGGGGGFVESSLTFEGNSNFTNCSGILGGAIYTEGAQVNFSGTNVFYAS